MAPFSSNLKSSRRFAVSVGSLSLFPVNDHIFREPRNTLRRLAVGVLELQRGLHQDSSSTFPYPLHLQAALDEISLRALCAGTAPPTSVIDLLVLCEEPLGSWSIALIDQDDDLASESLLWFGSPTVACHELGAVRGDFLADERESETLAMVRAAALTNAPTYVEFRKFIIEHPVVDVLALAEAKGHPALVRVAETLQDAYGRPRPEWLVGGKIGICSRCGSAVRSGGSHVRCTNPLCSGTVEFGAFLHPESTLVLRDDLQRFWAAPGRAELRIAAKLERLGVPHELWPEGDAYDLKVFDTCAWAVDVKAWRHPSLLAEHLDQKPPRSSLDSAEVFVVIADEVMTKGYVDALHSWQRGSAWKRAHTVSEKAFMKRVRDRLRKVAGQ